MMAGIFGSRNNNSQNGAEVKNPVSGENQWRLPGYEVIVMEKKYKL
jgi:hypothetical protein